jgi:hypothetical protein
VDCSPAIDAAAASSVAGVSTRYSAMILEAVMGYPSRRYRGGFCVIVALLECMKADRP